MLCTLLHLFMSFVFVSGFCVKISVNYSIFSAGCLFVLRLLVCAKSVVPLIVSCVVGCSVCCQFAVGLMLLCLLFCSDFMVL